MTKSNLYSVLCTLVRLAAVYLFVDAAVELVSMVIATRRSIDAAVWYSVLGQPVLQVILALLLWMFPGVLARIAGSNRSLEFFESDISPAALQYLALSTLGFWFAITGTAQFAYSIHRWIFLDLYLRQHLPDPTADPKVLGTLLSEAVRIFLGIGLAFGARGTVNLLRRYRQTGLVAAVADESAEKKEAS